MLSYIGISCIFGQFDSRYYPLLKIKTPNRFYRGDLVIRMVHRTNRSVSWTWGLPDLPGELAFVVHSAHDTRMNGIWLFRNLQNMHFFGGNRQLLDISTEIKFRCAVQITFPRAVLRVLPPRVFRSRNVGWFEQPYHLFLIPKP